MTTSYRVFLHDLSLKIEELNVLAEQLRRETIALEAIEDRRNGMWEGESRAIFHEAFVRDIYRMHHHIGADLVDAFDIPAESHRRHRKIVQRRKLGKRKGRDTGLYQGACVAVRDIDHGSDRAYSDGCGDHPGHAQEDERQAL